MSSQNGGTPFYNVPEGFGFRLLEIPPEVETLLEGPERPMYVPSLTRFSGYAQSV